jgi:bacillithiol biosynthesis cysteine-adding enzyme BshC
MVAVARWAEALNGAQNETPNGAGPRAVPVFWVATEDHDWQEITRTAFLTPGGLRRFDLGEDPDPLLPVGMRTLGPGVVDVLDGLHELRSSDRFESWSETLAGIYRPEARFGEAFCRLAVELLGERCPLLLDAMDPTVKRVQAPWLERLVEERAAWEAESERADRRIEERGYALQVSPQRGVSPLFELRDGERRRIEWRTAGDGAELGGDDDRYVLRGTERPPRPIRELREILDENPGTVSPGVLARPAIQDAILGTTLMVLGPGEMSYMAQAAPTYRTLGLEAPWVALRPQALVLEGHQREKLTEMELALAHLLGPDDALERRLAGDAGAGLVERARDRVEEALATLREETLELDPNLERPFDKTRQNVLRALETFGGKVTAAAARRDEVRARRVERLRSICLPEGTLQERVVSTCHWPGKYGERFIDALWDQMDLDGRHLQVIEP